MRATKKTKETNTTLSATTNTIMTKLYPQELSTYSENEYRKNPQMRKCLKPHGFIYLMICNTNKCKIGITKDLYQRWQQVNQQLVSSKTKVIYLYASPLCMNKLEVEKSFKEYFKEYNINGSDSKCEWFNKTYIQEYLKYLNTAHFDFNFPSIEQIEKDKENIHKFAEIIFSDYINKDIETNDNDKKIKETLLKNTVIINKANKQLEEIHDIFNYILPKEYEDSINYICDYNEISRIELLRLSLIMYMHNFNKNIESLPDKIKPSKSKNIFDELAAQLENE